MQITRSAAPAAGLLLALGLCACGNGPDDSGTGPSTNRAGGSGGTVSAPSGGSGNGASGMSGGAFASGGAAAGGAISTSGGVIGTGGSAGMGASSGTGQTGGASTGTGGGTAGGASSTTGGAPPEAGSGGSSGATGTGCTVDPWPEADPAATGPFETVTETDVGPTAGIGENAQPVAFTMFRPAELGQGGLCHPVVTWGNGTGSSPSLYGVLLRHLASHGFVVIASDSPNVADGDPPPMVAGVTWVLEQNDDPSSTLYQHIDVTHVGATGHSQGGFATTTAGGDSQITTIAPLCGASTQRNLHGPALLLCGGEDTTVPCSNIQRAFDGIDNQPVMLADYLTADHANWVTFRGTDVSPMEVAVTAWMRLQLMGDTSLRPWFYGSSCQLCTDSDWQISQKMMDQ